MIAPPAEWLSGGLSAAATFLGHARLDTTARYGRLSEEDLAEAAERLGE